jgi:translation initiation factor IF-3
VALPAAEEGRQVPRLLRGGQLKEIKFRTVKIGDHDLMIKVNHAREFLKEGNKVSSRCSSAAARWLTLTSAATSSPR